MEPAQDYLSSILTACARLQNMTPEEINPRAAELKRIDSELWDIIDEQDE
jgi:hypothetical protein